MGVGRLVTVLARRVEVLIRYEYAMAEILHVQVHAHHQLTMYPCTHVHVHVHLILHHWFTEIQWFTESFSGLLKVAVVY